MNLPKLALVLQLHPAVLGRYPDTNDLVRYLEAYVKADSITHVLFDPSGGRGASFEANAAIHTLNAIASAFPHLRRGVAGGLSPENILAKLRPIRANDPTISIDVEGRVRDPKSDELILERVVAYASQGLSLAAELDRSVSTRTAVTP